jgi:hypothetical protein
VIEPIYGIAALRRYREQHPVVEAAAAECAPVTDDDAFVVPDDDGGDDFDDLFDAWVDHNMEVSG